MENNNQRKKMPKISKYRKWADALLKDFDTEDTGGMFI